MTARCAVLLLLLAGPAAAADRPPGCLVRLGSDRFRFPGSAERSATSADGRWLAVQDGSRGRVFDNRTGERVWDEPEDDLCLDLGFDRAGRLVAVLEGGDGPRVVRFIPGRWDRPAITTVLKVPADHGSPRLDPGADVVAVPAGRRVRLYEAYTGQETARPKVPGKAEYAVFSGCGRWIVTGGEPPNRLHFLDRLTGQPTPLRLKQPFDAAAFLSDGSGLAVAVGDAVTLYALPDGTKGRRLTTAGPVRDMVGVSGKLAVLCAPRGPDTNIDRHKLQLLDPATGESVWTTAGLPDLNRSLSVTADGRGLIAVDDDGGVLQFDANTGRLRPEASADRVPIGYALQFLTDDRLAVNEMNGWAIWDTATGRRTRLAPDPPNRTNAISPDGTRAAVYADGRVRLTEARSGRLLRQFPAPVEPSFLTFVGGGRLVGVSGGEVLVWPTAAAVPPRRFPLAAATWAQPAVSADGRRLAAVSADGDENNPTFRLTRYDLSAGRELGTDLLPGPARTVAVSADGRWTVVVGLSLGNDDAEGGLVRVYETDTGRVIRQFVTPMAEQLAAVSADGRMLAIVGYDSVIHVLELATGGQRAEFHLPAWCSVRAMAFRPDGRRLATAATTCTIDIWDLESPPGSALTTAAGLWSALLAPDAASAFAAVRRLSADPATAIPLLRSRLAPVPVPDPARVDRWIADLDSPRYAVRAAAHAGLWKAGRPASARLRERANRASTPEARARLAELLAAADRLTPEAVRAIRAVEAIERIAADRRLPAAVRADARRLLAEWAAGAAPAPLTDEATAAGERVR